MDRSAKKPSKQKRKPKGCPNPLFLKWLEQWRDEARSKESKLQYVYSKAISSLKKYPLPLESGKEATLLDGVGPAIAKRLDEELAKHKSNLDAGCDVDAYCNGEVNLMDLRVPPPSTMMTTAPVLSSTSISSSSEDVTQPKPKKKRKSSPREYIPAYRSGPYAIMIALLKANERIGYKGYMTKAELQQQAQPYTDTSFTVPEPDSYYTAWSSMSTLIKKGLVAKAGNPARFRLTDSGHILAEKLLTATADKTASPQSPTCQASPASRRITSPVSPTVTAPVVTNDNLKNISSGIVNVEDTEKTKATKSTRQASTPDVPTTSCPKFPAQSAPTSTSENPSKDFLASYRHKISGAEVKCHQAGSLTYWFVNSEGQCVENEDQASVVIDEEISFGYLVKCKRCELERSAMKYKLDCSRPGQDGYVFAFLAASCVANYAANEKPVAAKSNSKVGGVPTANISDDSDDEMLMRPLFERLTKDPDSLVTDISNVPSTKTKTNSPITEKLDAPIIISDSLPTEENQPVQATQRGSTTSINDSGGCKPACSVPTREVVPEYELKPGSFEIILCVDFIETTGGSKTGRKEEMVKELKSNGVQFDVRKLNVGDFLWIAREKMLPLPGQLVLPERRELVLDYIVERKRMDDLCSSIKDGRFKEQKKFRGRIFLFIDSDPPDHASYNTFERRRRQPRSHLDSMGSKITQRHLDLTGRTDFDLDQENKLLATSQKSASRLVKLQSLFRLLNSGVRRPVYLVEDFGSPSFLAMSAQTLDQAIVNTQVGQDFYIKRTRDIKESAAYLTLMTRYLQTVYNNKTLKAIKKEDMEYARVDEDGLNTYLMTFPELSDVSLKNRILTVAELFGKQLLQIPGVAAEKVAGILEIYPTLRHLLDAYEEQTTEKEKESLLSGIKYGKNQRKLGPTVSRTVYQLYCTKGALS